MADSQAQDCISKEFKTLVIRDIRLLNFIDIGAVIQGVVEQGTVFETIA